MRVLTQFPNINFGIMYLWPVFKTSAENLCPTHRGTRWSPGSQPHNPACSWTLPYCEGNTFFSVCKYLDDKLFL